MYGVDFSRNKIWEEREAVSKVGRDRASSFLQTRDRHEIAILPACKNREEESRRQRRRADAPDAPIDGMSKRRMDCRSLKRSRSWLPP